MLKVNITGIQSTIDRVRAYQKNLVEVVEFEIEEGARNIMAQAIANLEVNDEGILRNSIEVVQVSKSQWDVVAGVFYAAYVEFGTGEQFDGQGFEEYARQFQGRRPGATWEVFVKNILAWMHRKGVNPKEGQTYESAAEGIASWIWYHGLEPHPFLFPALVAERPKILERIKQALKEQ